MSNKPFHYQNPFPLGQDQTEYYLLTRDHVSVSEFEGQEILKVEPQALTLFGQVQSDIIHRSAFWQLPLWLSSPANRASGEMVFDAEREIYFPQRPPVRRVKFIVVTIHAFAGC